MENHENGISPEVFLSNPYLSDMFQILSLSWDRDGSSYVSTMEAHKVSDLPEGFVSRKCYLGK